MEPGWKTRLRAAMTARGFTRKSLGRAVGRNERLIYDLLSSTDDPRMDTLAAVAAALGMSVSELRDGVGDSGQRVQIIGAVDAGEGWTVYEQAVSAVELSIPAGDPVALEVIGDSMAPVYRNGDVLVGVKHTGAGIDNLIGKDCIVQTESGDRFIKYLARGYVAGRYNLRSYNPANVDIENVRIAWVAPIVWVKRIA
jgi:phage repressor protein C with HTH and peptisase S24 domain